MAHNGWRSGPGGIMLFDISRFNMNDNSTTVERLPETDPERFYQQTNQETRPKGQRHAQRTRLYIDLTLEDEMLVPRSASPIPKATNTYVSSSTASPKPDEQITSNQQLFDEQVTFYASQVRSPTPTPSTSELESENDGNESERTDFLPDTPCPRRQTGRQATGKTSRHFPRVAHLSKPSQASSIGSQPSPYATAKRFKMIPPRTKSANDILRDIEQTPPRKWSPAERELLAIMYRFFEPRKNIPAVFKSITGTDRSDMAIRSQWEGHCLVYGTAISEYAQVMNAPFDDPGGYYNDILHFVERKAKETRVELSRRAEDENVETHKATRYRSRTIKQKFKNMWSRQNQRSRAPPTPNIPNFQNEVARLRGIPISSLLSDEMEVGVKLRDPPISNPYLPPPRLGFRIWSDEESNTPFSAQGFIAQTFASWKPPFPPPPDPSVPHVASILNPMLLKHLSFKGGDSVFISVSTSLLQTMSYLSRFKSSALVALIDLENPLLNEPNKKTEACGALKRLKSLDPPQAGWARYKGNTEYLIWADVPPSAILTVFQLDKLEELAQINPGCAQLLHFEAFKRGLRTHSLAKVLRDRNLAMNAEVAVSMAQIAKVFGVDQPHVKIGHISDFIARLIDGWKINCKRRSDFHTMNSYAMAFAASLSSRGTGHNLQSVMEAFLEGCRQGTDSMAYFSSRGRASLQQGAD